MKTKSADFLFEDQMPWEEISEGISRQIMGYDGQLMVVKLRFEAGAVGAYHSHFHSQSTYIASGKYEIKHGDKVQIMGAGDGFYAAPDVPHGVTCIEPGIVIDTFSPVRLDFIS